MTHALVFSQSDYYLLYLQSDTHTSSTFLEYDGDHNSYYYSRPEGSGGDGCDDPYSDDEDCYDYPEYDGSGSGEGDYYSGGYDDETGGGDESDENYPPWMTTTTKPSVVKTRMEDDDIKLDEPRSTSTPSNTKTTSTAGASGVVPSAPFAVRALLYFAFPLATCWLGNLFAAPSQSW